TAKSVKTGSSHDIAGDLYFWVTHTSREMKERSAESNSKHNKNHITVHLHFITESDLRQELT
ncbi:unnamed protein product, partial [Amoebophrya sp. A120]